MITRRQKKDHPFCLRNVSSLTEIYTDHIGRRTRNIVWYVEDADLAFHCASSAIRM